MHRKLKSTKSYKKMNKSSTKRPNITTKPTYTDKYGGQFWTDQYGRFHRDDDSPAVITINGDTLVREWWIHGQLHRGSDKPAIVHTNAKLGIIARIWYTCGQRHRSNMKPAFVICTETVITCEWWICDKMIYTCTIPRVGECLAVWH